MPAGKLPAFIAVKRSLCVLFHLKSEAVYGMLIIMHKSIVSTRFPFLRRHGETGRIAVVCTCISAEFVV